MNKLLKTLKACILISLLFGGVILSLSMDQHKDSEPSDHGQVLFSTVAKIGQELEKKYGMSSFGGGGGAKPDGIWLMSLSLKRVDCAPLNEEEARKLITQCVDNFLEAVNSDDQLKPFLKHTPFTAKNIQLSIFNYDKNQDLHRFPSIAIVSNIEGEIGFMTKNPLKKYGYHTEKYETYEEAVAILKQ